MTTVTASILHVGSREALVGLRDQILTLHGYQVDSTLATEEAVKNARERNYSLVLIDVEGDRRVSIAEQLCERIKAVRPEQKIAFICNYRVAVESDCPDEIIRSEFNPQAMVDGVKEVLQNRN